jgi:2',3'-cyclic-nucleotide 2'-phosphodiesterase (5'-nucleotidase family)
MTKTRAALAPLLALAAAGFAAAGFVFARGEGRGAGAPVKLVILHTNDIHGQFLPRDARGRKGEKAGGLAALTSAIAAERAKAKNEGTHLLLVDSGDWYQGTPEGNYAKDGIAGALVIDWMNRARFDASEIGNHEFDFGVANVKALAARAKFPVLGANILEPVAAGPAEKPSAPAAESHAVARAPMAKPYVVFERGGIKVAFVGLLTDGTPGIVAAGRLGDVTVPDEIAAGRKWFDIAKKEADVVMFLTHCGKSSDEKLARRVPETPVIFGGHTHTWIAQPNFVEHEPAALANNPWKPGMPARTYVTQTGAKTEGLDRVEIWIDPDDKKIQKLDAKISEMLLSETGEDPDTKEWIAKETGPVATAFDEVVAKLTAPAETAPKGTRGDPTANFMTDAMLWSARAVDPAVVAAFGNAGGVRTKIATGDLTRRTIYEIVPFDNTLVLLTLTGDDLLALLKEAFEGRGDSRLLSAGLVGAAAKAKDGSWDWGEMRLGGKPIDRNAKYRVAANSFIAEGQGGLGSFKLGKDKRDTGQLVRDAILDYATAKKTIALDDALRLRADRAAEPARK